MANTIIYLGIVLAALASVIVGWLWYAPFAFGPLWMRLRNAQAPAQMRMPWRNLLLEFIFNLVTAYVLALFLGILVAVIGSTNPLLPELVLGLIVWLAFYAMPALSLVVWERMPFTLALIGSGQRLVSILVMLIVLGFLG